MKKMKLIPAFIALIIFLFSFSACKWSSERETPKGRNIVCLVDFSDSENATERLEFYKTAIRNSIIPSLGLYDKIFVLPIDKASVTNSADIFMKDLSAKNFEPDMASPMEEEQLISDNLKKYKDSLVIEFDYAFQTAIASRVVSQHGTDLLGALEVVKNSKLKRTDENYLIIFSDMMNWSKTLNMEPSNSDFNANTIDKLVGKAPNYQMSELTVLVLTARQDEATAEHFKLVQSFWTKYFQKNGMTLYDYNSASISKLNELMERQVDL